MNGGWAVMRGGHNRTNHGTIEGAPSIDVMELARAGYLIGPRRGSIAWTDNFGERYSIAFIGGRDGITLEYVLKPGGGEGWDRVSQRVLIAWTPCRFGGKRPWFVCGGIGNGQPCGRRVAKLYGAGRLFACRHCHRLVHAVQWRDAMDTARARRDRLYQRLGAEPGQQFPQRPKWMRWRTYSRLMAELTAAEGAYDAAFCAYGIGVLARLRAGRKG